MATTKPVHTHPYIVKKEYSHFFFHPVRLVLSDAEGQQQVWKSRNHRKGKSISRRPNSIPPTLERCFAYWNVSWWTAVLFLAGSVCWLANGIVAFHEPISDQTTSQHVESYTGFAGGTLFYFGGWAMYWEALNSERTAEFDWAVRKTSKNILKAFGHLLSMGNKFIKTDWRWLGWDGARNLSFIANFTQFLGTSVFWISVIAYLPGVLPQQEEGHRVLYLIFFWIPQVVGASFLTLSSFLLTLETQKKWYLPKLNSVGWHVGFWNILGSAGFLLSGLFGIVYGPQDMHDRLWGVSFSTYLGSYFFLLGSAFQYYESVASTAGYASLTSQPQAKPAQLDLTTK